MEALLDSGLLGKTLQPYSKIKHWIVNPSLSPEGLLMVVSGYS